MHEPRSPIETPTTPSAPSLPLFSVTAPVPSSSQSTSMQAMVPTQHSPLLPVTTSTNQTDGVPIVRPLPLRPAVQGHASRGNRISKPSWQQQQQQPQRRSPLTRSPTPSRLQPTPHIRTVSPSSRHPPLTYTRAVSHLSTRLIPLISVTTGVPHPAFPRSLLQYHLLTHAQLDGLAVYYHQVSPPVRETSQYPVSVPGWVDRDGVAITVDGEVTSLETKRRRWGRFLGLKGCQSPVRRNFVEEAGEEERKLREDMEREWRRGIERRREEERLKEKAEGWRDRW